MSTDVLISFDTTGSMSPCIAEVRRRVIESFDKLFNSIPDLRIGLISHGDYCDGDKRMYSLNFTNHMESLKWFVDKAPSTSGGDSDEFYEYVFSCARNFDWQADNKVFMFIADANPHPVGYKYGGITYTLDWRNEVRGLADLGVSIYPIQAMGSRYGSRDNFYTQVASYSNGRKVDLSQFTDAVETIIAVCYHKVGQLDTYRDELTSGFKMNRNLAKLFSDLGTTVTDVRYTRTDSSGLIPVPADRFQLVHVDHDQDIKSFVLGIGASFKIGRGFYQFTKTETVQEHKEVVLRNKLTGDMFTGAEARNFIGLPFGVRGNIRPKLFDDYQVFIQSTSANRKLVGGTLFLYENEIK